MIYRRFNKYPYCPIREWQLCLCYKWDKDMHSTVFKYFSKNLCAGELMFGEWMDIGCDFLWKVYESLLGGIWKKKEEISRCMTRFMFLDYIQQLCDWFYCHDQNNKTQGTSYPIRASYYPVTARNIAQW